MSFYTQWCAWIGRVYGVLFLVECFASIAFRAWGPFEASAVLPLSAAIVYGAGTPFVLRRERQLSG